MANPAGPTAGRAQLQPGGNGSTREALPGERFIAQFGGVIVTTFRVQVHGGTSSSSRFVSMTLDSVASCSFDTSSQPGLLVLAVLMAIGGIVMVTQHQAGFVAGLLVGAVICLALYFATRRSALTIASKGGENIAVTVPALHGEAMQLFIDTVERSKLVALGRISSDGDRRASSAPPPVPR
jgi:hypothetical protein